MALALWSGHLRHNPANPAWPNRDRFVTGKSRTCFLLSSLLHLTGYERSLAEFDVRGLESDGTPNRSRAAQRVYSGLAFRVGIQGWQAEDTAARFRMYGWNVIGPIEGNDALAVGQAIALAKVNSDSPTLILCRNPVQEARDAQQMPQTPYATPRASVRRRFEG